MKLPCNRVGCGVGLLIVGVLLNAGTAQERSVRSTGDKLDTHQDWIPPEQSSLLSQLHWAFTDTGPATLEQTYPFGQGGGFLPVDPTAAQVRRVQNVGQKPKDSPTQAEKPPIKIDRKTRETLLAFVHQHHPELTRLLKSLEKNRPRQYQSAMRSLSNSYNRLQLLKDQGKTKPYDAALEQWKLSSRIKLKAAQVAVKDTPQQRKQLESLIAKQFDSRVDALRAEEARLSERLKRLSELMKEQSDRQLEIERNMDAVMRTATRNMQRAESDQNTDSDAPTGKKPVKQSADEKDKKPIRGKNKKSDKANDDDSN